MNNVLTQDQAIAILGKKLIDELNDIPHECTGLDQNGDYKYQATLEIRTDNDDIYVCSIAHFTQAELDEVADLDLSYLDWSRIYYIIE